MTVLKAEVVRGSRLQRFSFVGDGVRSASCSPRTRIDGDRDPFASSDGELHGVEGEGAGRTGGSARAGRSQPVDQVDYASTLENLVREIDRAGLALIDEIEALAGEVVQKTLGALDVREARVAAVNAVAREHSLDTPIEVHVPPEDSTFVTQVFSTDDQGVTNRYLVRVDPILRPGEIVVISPLGRIKAGPSARAAEVARFMRTSR